MLGFQERILILFLFVICCSNIALAQEQIGNGKGVDSQILWHTPGPSNFPTVASSDIVGHKQVSFSGMFDYYRRPIGLENATTDRTEWVVDNAFSADFMWGFGILDLAQIGLVLPLILEQNGSGTTSLQDAGLSEDETHSLAGSALRDIRANVKVRFLGGGSDIPDQRDFGIAFDLGVSVPTGDEKNFAGNGGVVMFPNAVFDFHRCMVSAALNLGARLRFDDDNSLADLTVGHQGTFGLGVTGHFLKRRLLLSAEGIGVVEFDGFDRIGVEYRGGVGYIPDKERSVSLWLAGGSSFGTGDVLGTAQFRALIGLTYAPSEDGVDCCSF